MGGNCEFLSGEDGGTSGTCRAKPNHKHFAREKCYESLDPCEHETPKGRDGAAILQRDSRDLGDDLRWIGVRVSRGVVRATVSARIVGFKEDGHLIAPLIGLLIEEGEVVDADEPVWAGRNHGDGGDERELLGNIDLHVLAPGRVKGRAAKGHRRGLPSGAGIVPFRKEGRRAPSFGHGFDALSGQGPRGPELDLLIVCPAHNGGEMRVSWETVRMGALAPGGDELEGVARGGRAMKVIGEDSEEMALGIALEHERRCQVRGDLMSEPLRREAGTHLHLIGRQTTLPGELYRSLGEVELCES